MQAPAKYNVVLRSDGFVTVEGRIVGFITKSDSDEVRVCVLSGSIWVEIATFSNYRPYMTARSWLKYLLERRTPEQLVLALKTRNKPLQYAKRLGFRGLASVEAERIGVSINKNLRTGSREKFKGRG